MTKNEIIQKNISLSFDFIKHLMGNPGLLEQIPGGAEIEFLEHDLPTPVPSESAKEPCITKIFKVEHIFREISSM